MAELPKYFYFRVTPVTNKGVLTQVMVEDASNADVVEVVRCRDCIYYNTTGCAVGFGWCEEPTVSNGVDDNYYCAGGVRRETND